MSENQICLRVFSFRIIIDDLLELRWDLKRPADIFRADIRLNAVLAADVSAKNLANTDEVGMIYTMASRAMHELVLLSNGSVSDAINEKAGRLLTIEYQLPNKN